MKRLGWATFFLLVLYFIFLIRQDIIDHLELKKEAHALAGKTEQEEVSSANLKSRLTRLKSDDLIEELARTRLGLIKKGEKGFKVIF
jgi:cell division protein FtsB